MTLMTVREAADTLGISESTLRRRALLLGIKTELDDDGRASIDAGEIARGWDARQKARPARQFDGGGLSFVVDDDTRAEVNGIVEHHGKSLGQVCRRLLHLGLVEYHNRGREL